MTFKREQEIRIEEKNYYIIDVIELEIQEYIYVQEIQNDELVENYKIYKYNKELNMMEQVKDDAQAEKLLKLFIENINKDLGEE